MTKFGINNSMIPISQIIPETDSPHLNKLLKQSINRNTLHYDHSSSSYKQAALRKDRLTGEKKLPTIQGPGTQTFAYLPIQNFKKNSLAYFCGKAGDKDYFVSSGTTSHEKSKSYFSPAGKDLYKFAAIKTFSDVLETFYGSSATAIQGFSLIPDMSLWERSSLAQMLTWIEEFFPVCNLTPDQLMLKGKQEWLIDRPVWLFATALHWEELFKKGFRCKLHPQSLVFETGGTKNFAKDLDRPEYYKRLECMFSIPQTRIVSEYGMCELASQAYEFIAPNSQRTRLFKFPYWVSSWVAEGVSRAHKFGKGSLLLWDPLRVDYPWPLRTQDRVEMLPCGGFTILGREKTAPQKGCSLLARDILAASQDVTNRRALTNPSSEPLAVNKLEDIRNLVDQILKNTDSFDLLEKEFGSKKIARDALEDFAKASPKTDQEWARCIKKSKAESPKKRWLMVLPNNHSLAAFYPLCVAAAANLRIYLRIPPRFHLERSFISILLDSFKRLPNPPVVEVLPPDFRITENQDLSTIDGIFCFGDTSTVKQLQATCGLPTVGFGSGFSAHLLRSPATEDIPAIIKDISALGTQGCLSSRVLCIQGCIKESRLFLHQLSQAFSAMSQHTTPDSEQVKSSTEQIPATLITRDDLSEFSEILENLRGASFQAILYDEADSRVVQDLRGRTDLLSLGTNREADMDQLRSQLAGVRICRLGEINTYPWDGTLHGKPLFLANSTTNKRT